MKRYFIILLLIIGMKTPVHAQFSVNGNESTFVKWNTFNTESYRFIYPQGCDSLAYKYAFEWEKYKRSVGYDGGFGHLPVVLHPYSSTSNGFVVWTPSRMEMYAAPSMYSPEAIPWHTMLAIHENRHVAQMQFLNNQWFKWTKPVFGELLAGPLSVFYSSSMFMEGDAVATETALTSSGRGRSADFLEYFRVCFENDDIRDFDKWRFGSQQFYTPDYYKIGYLSVAGMGAGPHTEFFDNTFRLRFEDFARGLQKKWSDDTRSRAPFQRYIPITFSEDYYTSYSGLTIYDGKIFAKKTGIADNTQLISIDIATGRMKCIQYIGADSRLVAGEDRLYWTEELPDLRWEMHSTSALRSKKGLFIRTELGGKRLYNPAYESGRLAVIENFPSGECYARVYLAGRKLKEEIAYKSPDGIQLLEPVWVDGHLYASAMNEHGQFICDVEGGCAEVLAPSPVKINHLSSRDGKVLFTSDRSGVNELYALDVKNGHVEQLTNLPQGGQDFVFCGDSLYFTVLSPEGRNICMTPMVDLPVRSVDFSLRYSYELADSLSAAVKDKPTWLNFEVSEPQRYSKTRNAMRIHSWIPFLYLDSDELLTMSSEQLYMEAGLGATAFFQNNLSTLYGNAGIKLFSEDGKFVPGLGFNVKYRGLYPVFEMKGMATTRSAYGLFRTYIPINLSCNGWSKGVIPIVSYEGVKEYSAPLGQSVVSAGIRAYAMLPKCNSNVFPKWGIGINLQDGIILETGKYVPSVSLYGYVPGFYATQGWSWNVSYINRYITDVEYDALLDRVTLDLRYGFSYPLDYSGFSPLFYLRNLEIIPFYEIENNWLTVAAKNHTGGFFDVYLNNQSLGYIINLVFGNLFCLPYDFRIGIKAGYNTENKWFCNFVMNYDL